MTATYFFRAWAFWWFTYWKAVLEKTSGYK